MKTNNDFFNDISKTNLTTEESAIGMILARVFDDKGVEYSEAEISEYRKIYFTMKEWLESEKEI